MFAHPLKNCSKFFLFFQAGLAHHSHTCAFAKTYFMLIIVQVRADTQQQKTFL